MKIFLADGRLGNQIFQYVFLKTIKKNDEKIIVSGFEDLKEVFEINDVINLNKENRWIRKFIFSFCKPIFYFLSDKKIISSIKINHEQISNEYKRESTSFSKEVGFIKNITFVKLGFFQSEKFFNSEIAEDLKIKYRYIKAASKVLDSVLPEKHNVFIHIRRGDYIGYTVYGESALLPIGYYKKQIEWFLKNKENCFFIFLSDEIEYVENEFSYLTDKLIVSDNHFGTDIAIMTLCKSAILSPSSFGWWGSCLMKERDIVFAPQYWLGFNSKKEYHSHSTPSYAKEITV